MTYQTRPEATARHLVGARWARPETIPRFVRVSSAGLRFDGAARRRPDAGPTSETPAAHRAVVGPAPRLHRFGTSSSSVFHSSCRCGNAFHKSIIVTEQTLGTARRPLIFSTMAEDGRCPAIKTPPVAEGHRSSCHD